MLIRSNNEILLFAIPNDKFLCVFKEAFQEIQSHNK